MDTDTLPASAEMLAVSRAVMRMSPVVAVIVDPSVTPAYTVFWMVLTASEPLTATPAPPADGDVVDAGAFLRAHLHGLRRRRMRARTPFCQPRRPRP